MLIFKMNSNEFAQTSFEEVSTLLQSAELKAETAKIRKSENRQTAKRNLKLVSFSGLEPTKPKADKIVSPNSYCVLDIDSENESENVAVWNALESFGDCLALFASTSYDRKKSFFAVMTNSELKKETTFSDYAKNYADYQSEVCKAIFDNTGIDISKSVQPSPLQSRFLAYADKVYINPFPFSVSRIEANKEVKESKTPNVFHCEGGYLSERLSELKTAITNNKKLLIEAPTGSGKTTTIVKHIMPFLAESGKTSVFAVPTLAICAQVSKAHTLIDITGKSEFADIQTAIANGKCVCTYDALHKLAKHFDCIFIDEWHELVNSITYRPEAVKSVLKGIKQQGKQIVMMTATSPKVALEKTGEWAKVVFTADKKRLSVKLRRFKGKPEQIALSEINKGIAKKQLSIIHLNSKKGIEATAKTLIDNNILKANEILKLYRDNNLTESEDYKQLIETDSIRADVKVILTTSLIEAGVNIKTPNRHVKSVYVATSYNYELRSFVQFSARVRTAVSHESKCYLMNKKERSNSQSLESKLTNFKRFAEGKEGAFFNDGGNCALNCYLYSCSKASINETDAIEFISNEPDFDIKEVEKVVNRVYKLSFDSAIGGDFFNVESDFLQKVKSAKKLSENMNLFTRTNKSFFLSLNTKFTDESNTLINSDNGYLVNEFQLLNEAENIEAESVNFSEFGCQLSKFKHFDLSVESDVYTIAKDIDLERAKDELREAEKRAKRAIIEYTQDNEDAFLNAIFHKTENSNLRSKLKYYFMFSKSKDFELQDFEPLRSHFHSCELYAEMTLKMLSLKVPAEDAKRVIADFELSESKFAESYTMLKTSLLLHLEDENLTVLNARDKKRIEKDAIRLLGKSLTGAQIAKATGKTRKIGLEYIKTIFQVSAEKIGNSHTYTLFERNTLSTVCEFLGIDFERFSEQLTEAKTASENTNDVISEVLNSETAPAFESACYQEIEVPF